MNFFRIWPGGHKFPADHGGMNIFLPKWKFVFIYCSMYYYFLFVADLFVMKRDCVVQGGPKKTKHHGNVHKIVSYHPFKLFFAHNLKE